MSSPASTRFVLDLVDGLAGVDDERDLRRLAAGRLAEAVAQLGPQEVGHDGHVKDAGILLEEPRERGADDRAGHDPATDDEADEQDDDEDEALPGARVGVALARAAQLPALHDADALAASRLWRLRRAHWLTPAVAAARASSSRLEDGSGSLAVDAGPPGTAGG